MASIGCARQSHSHPAPNRSDRCPPPEVTENRTVCISATRGHFTSLESLVGNDPSKQAPPVDSQNYVFRLRFIFISLPSQTRSFRWSIRWAGKSSGKRCVRGQTRKWVNFIFLPPLSDKAAWRGCTSHYTALHCIQTTDIINTGATPFASGPHCMLCQMQHCNWAQYFTETQTCTKTSSAKMEGNAARCWLRRRKKESENRNIEKDSSTGKQQRDYINRRAKPPAECAVDVCWTASGR